MARTDALVAAPTGVPACFPTFDGPADVFSVANYEGEQIVGRGGSGHQIARTKVRVNATARPVLILATAYESTIWSFALEPGAMVAGVMLSGYYQPMVEGLPDGTPVGRTYYGESNDRAPKVCGVTITPEEMAAVRKDIAKARDAYKQVANKAIDSERLAKHYRMFVKALADKGATDEMLALAQSIVDEAKALATAHAEASQAQRNLISGLEARIEGAPIKRLDFGSGRHFYVNDETDLDKLGRAFGSLGNYRLVSSQYAYTGPEEGFEISDEIAESEQRRKTNAQDALATLRAPPAKLLPPDAPRLVPPVDLEPDTAVQYLIDHGYAAESRDWAKYVCALKALVAFAAGHDGARACEGMFGPYLVLLGPITFPEGLYGADRAQFILPLGVPEPDGTRGHSSLIRISDVLAGEDNPFM